MEINGNIKESDCRFYQEEEVLKHCTVDDCWVIERGTVYDVTPFLEKHPGGAELVLARAGTDITDILNDENTHIHTHNAYSLLREYRVGKIEKKTEKERLTKSVIEEEFSMKGWKEDRIDWNKGLVLQVHKLGKDYMKWVHSPVNRKLRLFDSDFVEFFSKTPWYVVPLIWIPVTIMFSIISIMEIHNSSRAFHFFEDERLRRASSFLLFLCFFLVGIPMWTFVEYILHRFLFHLEPEGDSPLLITFHFFLHGQHHKVPFDGQRLVFPPVAAAVFAAFFLWILTMLLPVGISRAVWSGGVLGYVGYDMLHYYFHHGTPERGTYLHSLKYYHVLHHFDDHSTGYGISTKFWDYPFSTVNKKVL